MNNLQINQVLLERKQQILLSSILKSEFNQDLKIEVAQLNNVLMKLGYRLSYNLTQYLMMTTKEYILEVKVFLLKKIREMVGYAREMKPLFPNFPQVVSSMDVVDIIIFNIIYADLGFDRDAFDEVLNLFGIVEDEIKEEDKNISSNLKVIDIASLEDLQNLIIDMINSKTVYSKQDKEDLEVLFEYYVFDIKQILPEKIYFKENMVYIIKLFVVKGVDIKEFSYLLKTYTDILRLAVELSDGDTSLSQKTRFKNFTRRERKILLQLFDNCKVNLEDMLRHRQMYLRLGEKIHPGEYREKYPKAFKVFDMLRNNEDEIKRNTFNHKKEMHFKNKDIPKILNLLESRPGEFARSLNRVLTSSENLHEDSFKVIDRFIKLADNVPIATLLSLQEYFLHRNDLESYRVFYPKGNISKVYALENNLQELDENLCSYAATSIQNKIIEILSKKEPLGKVFIDKNLEKYVAPLKMRDTSKTLMPMERGTRIDIENKKIRLFLHWVENTRNTDLDLSIVLYDEDFYEIDDVSYMNLKTNGCVHSGDVRSAPAPKGGTEYVDINLDKINEQCRYISVCINAYTHEKFYELQECFVGYMDLNKKLKTAYNPSCVKFKADLTSETTVSLPFIIDIASHQIVWCDIEYTSLGDINNIITNSNRNTMVVKSILDTYKPKMEKLARLNAIARGVVVDDISEADIIFTDKKDNLVDAIQNARIITPFDTEIISSELL